MDRQIGEIYLNDDKFDGDGPITLQELLLKIPELQKKYGKYAVIRFDAGYNNVNIVVKPTKKQ